MSTHPFVLFVRFRNLTILGLSLFTVAIAKADILVQIKRQSAVDASVAVTGSLGAHGLGGNLHILMLSDPFLVDPPTPFSNNNVFVASSLRAGSYNFNFAYDAGSGFDIYTANTIYFGGITNGPVTPIPTGQQFSGVLQLHLGDGSQFASVGATGPVLWGGSSVGTWQVTSVPEPNPMILLAFGLPFVISGVRHARRSAK